jgi:hypothetical protein
MHKPITAVPSIRPMPSAGITIPVARTNPILISQHHPRLVPIVLVLLIARRTGVSQRRDELGTPADARLAGEGVANAGVEAHAGATGQRDGEPLVRAGVRLEGCCCAHRDAVV